MPSNSPALLTATSLDLATRIAAARRNQGEVTYDNVTAPTPHRAPGFDRIQGINKIALKNFRPKITACATGHSLALVRTLAAKAKKKATTKKKASH
jgi:hypothetical protein